MDKIEFKISVNYVQSKVILYLLTRLGYYSGSLFDECDYIFFHEDNGFCSDIGSSYFFNRSRKTERSYSEVFDLLNSRCETPSNRAELENQFSNNAYRNTNPSHTKSSDSQEFKETDEITQKLIDLLGE